MPESYDDIEREILEEIADDFYIECDERLQEVRGDLIAIEAFVDTDRVDKMLLDNIYRIFHTLKGLTGMMNIDLAVTLSHKLENYLRILCEKKARLSQIGIDTLMSGTQRLEEIISAHRNKNFLPDITALLSSIEKLTDKSTDKSTDTSFENKVDMDTAPISILQLNEDEAQCVQEDLEQGKNLYCFNFIPSPELSERGVNVNTVRKKLKNIGKIIKAVPTTNEKNEISFDFLITGSIEQQILDQWKEDRLTLKTHNYKDLFKNLFKDMDLCENDYPVEMKHQPKKPDLCEDQPVIYNQSVNQPDKKACYQPANLASSNFVRVDLSRLDDLMQMVGDLVIDRARLEDHLNHVKPTVPNANWYMLDETLQSLEKKIRSLREGIMRVRMVQINDVFERMRFTVRDLTRDNRKQINLQFIGKETEIDKLIVERMMDPLIHMVRNSISHGIEFPEQRKKLNKPQEGLISLRALTSGDMVVIEIEDDGQGLDIETIVQKARKKNIIDDQTSVNLDNLLDIICSPGFSIKEIADHASGRGVGMDVVKKVVEDLGGVMTVATEKGKGSLFRIQLPLTLAILDALIVTVGDQRFAVPKLAIQEIIEVDPDFVTESNQNEMILYRNKILPIIRLSRLFHIKETYRRAFYVMIVQRSHGLIGIAIDRVINEREIVVRALSDPFVNLPGISGATEIGDGRVVLILDVQNLSYHNKQSNKTNPVTIDTGKSDSMTETKTPQLTATYILFELGKTTYGVPSQFVRQLEMIEDITSVPNAPDFIEGVVFSRGQVIPAINLRLRFGLEKIEHTIRSRLLIINNNNRTVGLITDTAKEFVSITLDDIHPPPEEFSAINDKYITGITKLDHRMIILIHIENILDLADTISLEL